MDKELDKAFKIVMQACSSINTTLQGHQQIQAALQLIKTTVEEKEKKK